MSPTTVHRLHDMSGCCYDVFGRLCALVMPGFVLSMFAAALGAMIMLEGKLFFFSWMAGGQP